METIKEMVLMVLNWLISVGWAKWAAISQHAYCACNAFAYVTTA
jgi:hypothetical protein